jgi:hypothetical protein
MSTIRKIRERKAEIAGLNELLAKSTDSVFEKPLLTSKIEARQKELSEWLSDPALEPEAELLFGGGGVLGSVGIEAKFAGRLLDAYQDMVSNHHGGKSNASMSSAGRRPLEQQSKLYLTALPRGSMGLRLTQPNVEDFVAAQQVSEAMEQLTGLVKEAATTDENFVSALTEFHPRVLKPLSRFLEALKDRHSSVTIRSGKQEAALDTEQVARAYERASTVAANLEKIILRGIFRGILAESWRYDFVAEDGRIISGRLHEDVTAEEAHEMGRFFDQKCEAEFAVTIFVTRAGTERRNFELLRLNSLGTPNT